MRSQESGAWTGKGGKYNTGGKGGEGGWGGSFKGDARGSMGGKGGKYNTSGRAGKGHGVLLKRSLFETFK